MEVCRAVQHAHLKGIIHRDLKPSNVMVTMRDDRAIPKVIDFGIAKALSQKLTDDTVYTGYGQLVGTPLYMSPEQAQMNEVDVDTRSDVYSLGILLYELLTGVTPFDQETIKQANFEELRRIIREDEPLPPSDRISTLKAEKVSTVSDRRRIDVNILARSLRGELDWIVMKSLGEGPQPKVRIGLCFRADVERYLRDELVHARPPSSWYRFRKFARRKKGTLAVVFAACLLVVTVAGSVGWRMLERSVRQTRVAIQADLILDDAGRLMKEQEWSNALVAAERGKALIATGEGDSETEQRVRQLLVDLGMVQRLDKARQRMSAWNAAHFDYAGAADDFAEVFRAYGIALTSMNTEDRTVRLRLPPELVVAFVAGLDDWAGCLNQMRDRPGAGSSWSLLTRLTRIHGVPVCERPYCRKARTKSGTNC